MQSLLCHILFALTVGSSDKLARTQQHKHVPIRVLVVDVESLGGAQQLWKRTEDMEEIVSEGSFSLSGWLLKSPPSRNDPVFVFTVQCFFSPCTSTHHHLLLRKPQPPTPSHQQRKGTFHTSCCRTLSSINMSFTQVASKWIINKSPRRNLPFQRKTGQQDWKSFNCNLPRNRHNAVCPISRSFTA